jgi:hypothetical protein
MDMTKEEMMAYSRGRLEMTPLKELSNMVERARAKRKLMPTELEFITLLEDVYSERVILEMKKKRKASIKTI